MLATLTVQGPLDALARIAVLIQQQFAEGVRSDVQPLEVDGWSVERAALLLARLATKQRTVLELVVRGDGHVDDETLRAHFANGNGQVRGLTGPISKHVKNM